jgi:DNA gyrase subunit A
MRLSEGDVVVDMAVIEEGGLVLCITENGYGKRTDPEEFRETARNGKGVRAMNITEKTGLLCAQLVVHEDEDLMIITDDGTMIRTPVSDIRVCGRATQGVRLMRIGENSRVVGVARASAEEPEETESETAGDPTDGAGQSGDLDMELPAEEKPAEDTEI